MDQVHLKVLRDWFDGYVRGYYSDDPELQIGVRLKEEHTLRVCRQIVQIGRSLQLTAEDLNLAEAVALLHDLGRFKQYAQYRTFNDRRSENHALLGLRELDRVGALRGLPGPEQSVIRTALEHHNACDLPGTLQGRELLFSRLIRDADKLDILEMTVQFLTSPSEALKPVLGPNLPDTGECSTVLVENLLQQKKCYYDDVKTLNDRKLLLLSWLYDLNFPYSLAEAARKGYINKIIDSLPDTEIIRSVDCYLQHYLMGRLRLGK
ncbi:HD domain protein [Pelotomaculum schinkii]|uniref:HD domain protein n=1 Tax=Pelotomaculum schinkii TaxID=78350 RepID=A0A4Y7RG97_9FIRM|nr:HD domain-containing protein [Pelotomaculum schinkii]TEB07779.1 HD domain protein [Pelotomaculum schinkii]